MLSLITVPNHFVVQPRLAGYLNFPAISLPLALVVNPIRCRRRQTPNPAVFIDLESCSFGFRDLRRRRYEGSWWCWCKGGESEGDLALEAEILEFMKNSEKPEVFPTKKELLDAGRMDLVEAIKKKGGWLSLGWDLENDTGEEKAQEIEATSEDRDDELVKAQENGRIGADCDEGAVVVGVLRDFQRRVERSHEGNSFEIGGEAGCYDSSSVSASSLNSPSSSGTSLEMVDEQETGIGGILTRLEKQRNLSFGINLGQNGDSGRGLSKFSGDDSNFETSKEADCAELGRNSRFTSGGIMNNSSGKFSQSTSVSDLDGSWSSLKPEMWRTWSIQRAGSSDAEFEAAEISFNGNQMHEGKDASKNEMLAITGASTEALDKQKITSHSDIRTRLQQMELELTSALHLLRSDSKKFVPKEGHETSNDMGRLSDDWEFQENEIMKAQDRLRSIRAKLAVLEGKMALAIINAQKVVEEKQKRIDGACRALQLLRTTCIVWPNTASEVQLAGSFDGWTTQRKMEKSSTGIFSAYLNLYPGRYEIKFIVDGKWKIDPLRPIVRNNGHENNLLIITEANRMDMLP